MKRFLLSFAVCVLAFPLPVVAQEEPNAIIIIREDGSKEVIPLGGAAPPVPAPAERRAPSVEVETRSAPDGAASRPKIAPTIERAARPVTKPNSKAAPVQTATPKAKPKNVRKDALALIPPRKPHRQIMPTGEGITKDKALYIALSEAPPSRDVQVYTVQSEQGAAYSVLFKTDEGAYEVLVDAGSGVILSSGAVQVERSYVKPGHLPARSVTR